jgi:anti-sigma28 factor (negative regulator of flagellin synthesis)
MSQPSMSEGDGIARCVWDAGLAARYTEERSMNPLSNVGSTSPVQKLTSNPIQKQIPTDAPAPLRATDRLELSGVSHLLKSLKTNDVRVDKVATVKSQIEAGNYDADGKKMDAAIDKMLDDLMK